ncbi:MAG: hypothetical protein HN457_06665 [Opitutales bacterium]|jgi:hypothetical protein|nr:hypothetical protein [Opitutales bacterium]MBT5813429.1 hypothetical protein [Opitutales bacterium]MBT7865165.1 hypothetical protein [Opitutales bacterium]
MDFGFIEGLVSPVDTDVVGQWLQLKSEYRVVAILCQGFLLGGSGLAGSGGF